MSKVFKILGTISGVVSMVGNIVAPGNPISAALAVNSAIMGTLAKVTAKKPPAQGSLTQILIQANAQTPYLMGETYFGGVMRHDVGYGGKVSKVQNPYRSMPVVYSGCGPVQGLVGMYADFIQVPFSGAAATGYYAGFMYRSYQLGATPEASALAPQWSGMPGWSSAHKLSGKAAIMWGLKFDKEGEVFAGAVPQLGAIWQGVKVYDPRLDSTRPGGSGAHRIDNEATWAYSQNPALHALTYAYGRYRSGKKIFGIGLPADSILIANFTAWANVCDANGWKVGGIIFEPGDRWANLKRIMAAGSAEPIFAGGALSVKYDAPRVSLVTITGEDMVDGDCRVRAMQTWRDRINTIVPKYRSALHKWEYVESAAIVGASYLAEDGEEKIDTYQVDLCQDKDQAAQLAAYKLVNGREISPIEITLKPGFRFYRPGDMVTINEPEMGLVNQDCVIIRRIVDPQTFAVQFTLMSETAAKHDFALGKTGTAPPTPTLTSSEDKDNTAQTNALGGQALAVVFKRSASAPSTPADSSGTPSGWYPDTGSVPVDDEPLWASYGERENAISDFVWQTPVRVEGQDGAPGAPGANGVTTYTWYAYADAPDGSFNFTTGNPGARVYQGIAANKTTATESSNPADYQWAQYAGPPNFGLASFNSNTVLAGNKLIKVADSGNWSGSIHSTESFKGGASVSFVVDTALNFMVGLNTDPTTDASYTSIDFAIWIADDGGINLYESGTPAGYFGTYVVGDTFSVTYNGKTVVYAKNGVPFHTNNSPAPNLTLFLDSSMVYAGHQMGRILSFTATGTAGAAGTDGAPGAPGANGTTYYTWYAYADAADGSFNFTTGSPGSRQFQGIAYNKTTATESTNPADYAWSDYVGPPNFGLAAFDTNTIVSGNKLIKVTGGYAWNGSIHSTESFKGGASVSFVVDSIAGLFMVGLNTDPTTDASYGTLDFAIYIEAGVEVWAWENGAPASATFPPAVVGDVFSITYNGKTVVYAKNGVPFYTNNSPAPGLSLYLDTALHAQGIQAGRILSFTAAGTAGSDGSPGISPVNALAVPANKQFMAESDGTIKDAGSVLPFNVAIDGMKAGATISGTVTILAVSGCTATAISGGFTIDTVTADAGFVSWRFTASDGQVVENKMSFSRQRDPASGGAVSVNFSSTSWWGSGSYGATGPATVLPASSTGKLQIAGYASFYCSGNGQAYLTGKLQYRAVGSGTWLDSGFTSGPSVAIKTADAPGEPGENSPGEVSPGGTLTGLTANGSYEVQMVGLRNASFNAIASASGFISMRQVL